MPVMTPTGKFCAHCERVLFIDQAGAYAAPDGTTECSHGGPHAPDDGTTPGEV
jgi:hypothetical protein